MFKHVTTSHLQEESATTMRVAYSAAKMLDLWILFFRIISKLFSLALLPS